MKFSVCETAAAISTVDNVRLAALKRPMTVDHRGTKKTSCTQRRMGLRYTKRLRADIKCSGIRGFKGGSHQLDSTFRRTHPRLKRNRSSELATVARDSIADVNRIKRACHGIVYPNAVRVRWGKDHQTVACGGGSIILEDRALYAADVNSGE